MMRIAAVLLCCLAAAGCRWSGITYRPDVDPSTLLARENYRSIPVLSEFPEDPSTFRALADVTFKSTGLDVYSIAETWLKSRAGEAGADALVIEGADQIRMVGWTQTLNGTAIRWVEHPGAVQAAAEATPPAEPQDPASDPQRP